MVSCIQVVFPLRTVDAGIFRQTAQAEVSFLSSGTYFLTTTLLLLLYQIRLYCVNYFHVIDNRKRNKQQSWRHELGVNSHPVVRPAQDV